MFCEFWILGSWYSPLPQVKSTGGGDWEECYELVLHQARTVLNWSPGTQRALVMIGDAIPHDTNYADNKAKIDWKRETKALWEEMGVRIYAVQCQRNPSADFFYKHLADNTDGKWVQLDEFQNVVDMLMAICYREQGPDMFLVRFRIKIDFNPRNVAIHFFFQQT